MVKIEVVPRIGSGTEMDPYRPDTQVEWWQVVEEKETEFIIEIIEPPTK